MSLFSSEISLFSQRWIVKIEAVEAEIFYKHRIHVIHIKYYNILYSHKNVENGEKCRSVFP